MLALILLGFIFSISNQGWEDEIEYILDHLWEKLGATQIALESKSAEKNLDSIPVTGIYSLMRVMEPVNPSVLQLPFVEGISIRVVWKAIEPEEGRFDWSYLDNAFHEVGRAKKYAMLRVLPGTNSPDWIYKKGVNYVEFKDLDRHHKSYSKILRMPVPWNDTYITEWIKFIYTLGKRYAANPTLILIHMAGPTYRTAEMYLPRKGEAPILLEKAGYSKDKFVTAWKKVIDAYSYAFPGKSLGLNIDVPLKIDGALEEIIEYGIARIGTKLCIQGNWLSAYTPTPYSFYPYNTILRLVQNKAGVNIGFQMLGSSEFRATQQGPLDVAVQKGLNAGARYFEIYQEDIIKASNRQLFEELNKELMKN